MRLDNFISELKGISRSQAQDLIKKECVKIDGKTIKKNAFEVSGEEEILIKEIPKKDFSAKATKMPLDIIYEDDSLLVLNKDKGKQVYPGDEGDMTNTLLSGLRHYFSKEGKIAENDSELTVETIGFVHRLDKDTSGILLIAKNKKAHEFFAKQFENREVKKIYLTLVYGNLKNSGKIDSPIGRSTEDRKKMSVGQSGRNSLTLFDPIEFYPELNATFLKVQILTGRTHQIRVHLSAIGHPVAGDWKYGNEKINKEFEKKYGINSQVLHSYQLEIKGQDGQLLSFSAKPKDDFEKLGIKLH